MIAVFFVDRQSKAEGISTMGREISRQRPPAPTHCSSRWSPGWSRQTATRWAYPLSHVRSGSGRLSSVKLLIWARYYDGSHRLSTQRISESNGCVVSRRSPLPNAKRLSQQRLGKMLATRRIPSNDITKARHRNEEHVNIASNMPVLIILRSASFDLSGTKFAGSQDAATRFTSLIDNTAKQRAQ